MSMEKIVSLFLCVAMIFAASALAESAITPGTYEGAGEGFDAAGIKVNVTLNEEGIEAIEVLENNETPSVGGAAMETLIPQIIEGQTLAVDAVAGATLSSNGLKAAVADALTAAGFGALCEGQTVDYCVERMGGILCHGSNGSSCPDQSAKALTAAKGLIDGTLCDNCGAAE